MHRSMATITKEKIAYRMTLGASNGEWLRLGIAPIGLPQQMSFHPRTQMSKFDYVFEIIWRLESEVYANNT